MAFADPQSLTINAVPVSLPRVTSPDVGSGRFAAPDTSIVMTITQQDARRRRQTVRVQSNKTVPDSLNPTNNVDVSMSVTLVVDAPGTRSAGVFTLTEKKYIVDALVAYLAASSGAKVTQLLGGES